MKNIWLKHKLLVIILGYVLLLGLGIYFLIMPLVSRIKISSDRMQGKLIDQQIEQTRLDSLPQIKEDWLDFESKKEAVEVILSSRNELEFIENIEAMADKTGNTISFKISGNTDPQETSRKKTTNKKDSSSEGVLDDISHTNFFFMQINLEGDYDGLVNFIHMLENSQFYVNVISIEAQKDEVDNSQKSNNRSLFSFSAEESDSTDNNKEEIIKTNINAIVYTKE